MPRRMQSGIFISMITSEALSVEDRGNKGVLCDLFQKLMGMRSKNNVYEPFPFISNAFNNLFATISDTGHREVGSRLP